MLHTHTSRPSPHRLAALLALAALILLLILLPFAARGTWS